MTDTYPSCWTRFMCFLSGITHDTKATFTEEAVLAITPEDICAFLNSLAYGKPAPGPDDKPTKARSTTLEFYKKAISSFMPRQMIVWDDVRREGNPTRSVQVNKLIKRVRKCEVRQEGVESAARRALTWDEFVNLLMYLRCDKNELLRLRLVAVLVVHWQLIGCIDDMMQLNYSNFIFNSVYEFTIFAKLRWSKNITEERDAPQQILLGSMDERVCVLLNLAMYLEIQQQEEPTPAQVNHLVFESRSKKRRSTTAALAKAFAADGFIKTHSGPVGTYSIRKGAKTFSTRTGVSKDIANRRGRWRKNKGVIDAYIETTQPYPDALEAAALTGPQGPIKYARKPDAQFLTHIFLLEAVAPGITGLFSRQLAVVLALPILWCAFSTTAASAVIIPATLKEKIVSNVRLAGGDHTKNPVEQIPIHVSGVGDMVNFIELGGIEASEVSATNGQSNPGHTMRELACVNAQLGGLKRRVEEVHADASAERAKMRSDLFALLDSMHRSIKRIAIQPVVRAATVDSPAPTTRSTTVVKLPDHPRDLYILWKEYEFGREGVKPAKAFTAVERGANMSAYSRRKIFWELVETMTLRGHTSDAAIDKIYSVYGRGVCVTDILNKMRVDRANGGHPEL